MVNGYVPKTLAEALELRSKYDLVPYAGGTAGQTNGNTGTSGYTGTQRGTGMAGGR